MTGLLLTLTLIWAAPPDRAEPPVLLRDIKPDIVKGGRVLRSRTDALPGLFIAGKRYRGLNCASPSRVGFHTNAAFTRLKLSVAVLDGSKRAVMFKVLGDGRTLFATPPLFAGNKPLPIDVDVTNVLLLELQAVGDGGARAAWLGGKLFPAKGRDLGSFRAIAASFSPRAYPTKFRRRVNAAIRKGVAYLKGTQRGGAWKYRVQRSGATALATLALLKAGVKPNDPAIVHAFQWLRTQPLKNVYSVACLLMALEARYFPGGADEKTAYLDRPKRAQKIIPAEVQSWIGDAAAWVVKQQGMGFPKKQRALHPVWRYPAGGYDMSNTQYALLGLSAANRCGVATRKAWLPALRVILGALEKEGPAVARSR